MRIDGMPPVGTYSPQQLHRKPVEADAAAPEQGGIGQQITQAIDKVNTLQVQADQAAEGVASGNTEDVHKAMIAMEHALVSLDFTLQVRNKILEAYQEVMKTQI